MFPRVYKEIKPDSHLKDYIKCYWLYERDFTSGQSERVLPDSSYELVHTGTAAYRVGDQRLSTLFMVGQLAKPLDFYATGTVRQWCVRFFPWGLLPFGDVTHLTNKSWEDAQSVLGSDACKTLRALSVDTDEQTLANRLDEFFMQRLLAWQFDDTFLKRAARRLLSERGNIKMKELAEYCYLSRRQLGRNIKQATGQNPHEVASRLRFESVRDTILHNPDVPLTYVASEHGYSDQSHLIKEFRRYTDLTPSDYAALSRAAAPRLQNRRNVTFLQSPDNFTE